MQRLNSGTDDARLAHLVRVCRDRRIADAIQRGDSGRAGTGA